MEKYEIAEDDAVKAAFPDDVQMPALLERLIAWLRGKPLGSVGMFSFEPETLENLTPAGDYDPDDFGCIFSFYDGGVGGLWFNQTRDPLQAPVFSLSSEGEMKILAPNLPLFIHRWANADFDPAMESDWLNPIREDEDIPEDERDESDYPADLHAALAEWASAQDEVVSVVAPGARYDFSQVDDGSAQAWFDALQAAADKARDEVASDPHARAIGGVLLPYVPQRGRVQVASFRAFAAGDVLVVCEGTALVTDTPRKDLRALPEREIDALRPHLSVLREEFARSTKGQGLWPSADITIERDGRCDVDPTPDHPPPHGLGAFSDADYIADHRRVPRSKPPRWLQDILNRNGASKIP